MTKLWINKKIPYSQRSYQTRERERDACMHDYWSVKNVFVVMLVFIQMQRLTINIALKDILSVADNLGR